MINRQSTGNQPPNLAVNQLHPRVCLDHVGAPVLKISHFFAMLSTCRSHAVCAAYHVLRLLKLPTAALHVVECTFRRGFKSYSAHPLLNGLAGLALIRAVQVDGGSEFAAEFEQACQQRGLHLFVLPPRSPKLERANRTHTEEFYQVTPCSLEMKELNRELRHWENTSNTVRPHQSLGYLTPHQFLLQTTRKFSVMAMAIVEQ